MACIEAQAAAPFYVCSPRRRKGKLATWVEENVDATCYTVPLTAHIDGGGSSSTVSDPDCGLDPDSAETYPGSSLTSSDKVSHALLPAVPKGQPWVPWWGAGQQEVLRGSAVSDLVNSRVARARAAKDYAKGQEPKRKARRVESVPPPILAGAHSANNFTFSDGDPRLRPGKHKAPPMMPPPTPPPPGMPPESLSYTIDA